MVTVYSKPNCMQCDFTKRQLSAKGVEYTEVDVTAPENAELLEQLKLHGYSSMPIVTKTTFEDKENTWCGLRPDEIGKL